MGTKLNIDKSSRTFYYDADAKRSDQDGRSLELPKKTMQAAIDAAAALSPSPFNTARVKQGQGGALAEDIVLVDSVLFEGSQTAIIGAGGAVAVTAASNTALDIQAIVGTADGSVALLIDGKISFGAFLNALRQTGANSQIVKVTGSVDDIFVSAPQVLADADGICCFRVDATSPVPIDFNSDTVILKGDNCTFLEWNQPNALDVGAVQVTTIAGLGAGSKAIHLLPTNVGSVSCYGHIIQGEILCEGGGLVLDALVVDGDLTVKNGVIANLKSIGVFQGNINVEVGGVLFIEVDNHIVGTVTNNGTINGRIGDIHYGDVNVRLPGLTSAGGLSIGHALTERLRMRYQTDGAPINNVDYAQIIVDAFGNLRFSTRTNLAGDQIFYTGSGTTAVEAFRIKANGQLTSGIITPDASAAFDLFSTTRGFLKPRMSTIQRDLIASPASGLEIYNTTDSRPEHYDGTGWTAGAGAGDVAGPAGAIANALSVFSGTSGKIIKAALLKITDDGTNATIESTAVDGDINLIPNGLGRTALGVDFTSGINWVDRTAFSKSWKDIAFANGLFVAVASTSVGLDLAMFSSDGINWTLGTTPNNGNWVSVAFGNGIFVAIAQTGTLDRIMTSPDGDTWTARTASVAGSWKSIAFGNGTFVTVASNADVMTSPDGINWTTRTGINRFWRDITFGNGMFVATAQSGTGDRAMTSPDGINWTGRTTPEDNVWASVTFGNDLFVAVSQGGSNRVMTSPDGVTWTLRTAAGTQDWRAVDFSNGLFIAVSVDPAPDNVMTSPDGIAWTLRAGSSDGNWVGLSCGDGMCIAVGSNVNVMTTGRLDKNSLVGDFNATKSLSVLGTPVAVLGSNVIIISQDSEWPKFFKTGKRYIVTAPITVTAGNESTIDNLGNITIDSTDRINNSVTYTGTTGTLFSADALTGSLVIDNIGLLGNGSTSRLFNLMASGFPGLTLDKVDIRSWGAVSELNGFGGGIAIGKISGSGNSSGVFNVVNSVFFGVENCFFQNFSDTASNFFTIDALTSRVAMLLTGVVCQPNENVFNIDSSFTGEVIITTEFGTPAGQLFDAAGLDGTSIYVDVNNASNQPDSTTSAELFLIGNTVATDIPAAGAMVEINNNVNWTEPSEQMTVSIDGVVRLDSLSPENMAYSANINLEPATATKNISIKTVSLSPTAVTITFTNGTNLINEAATALADGDLISFRDTVGTLPAEIRADVVYFVVSKLANSFQVAYTSGGSAIAFTDDGTPINTYKGAGLEGATPTNTIAAANGRDLIPQATIPMVTNSKAFLVVINNDDAVDIMVNSGYQRYSS